MKATCSLHSYAIMVIDIGSKRSAQCKERWRLHEAVSDFLELDIMTQVFCLSRHSRSLPRHQSLQGEVMISHQLFRTTVRGSKLLNVQGFLREIIVTVYTTHFEC